MPFVHEWRELADTYAERVGQMIERELVFDRMTESASGPPKKSPFLAMMFGNHT